MEPILVTCRLTATNLDYTPGLETWFHLLHPGHDQRSVIEDFTVWNTRDRGVFIPYTNQTTLRDVTAIRDVNKPRSTAIGRNNVTANIRYENMRLEGWKVGVDVARNGENVVQDGTFNNIKNILITTTHSTFRLVDINGAPEFKDLGEDALRGQTQHDIFMQAAFNLKDRDLAKLFSPDIVKLSTVRFNGKQVYYHEQAWDFVPFKHGQAPDYIPPELIGKTNQQIWDAYGVALGGAVAPENATTDPSINGLVGEQSDYLPELKLRSRKYTRQLENYQLSYNDGDGDRVRDPERVNLREGWNLITRTIDGVKRTFFIYGDTTAPVLVPSSDHPLVIHPNNLDKGFVLHGRIQDDSFGDKKFKKAFKPAELMALEIQERSDGTRFILLEFDIKDSAGNTTHVALELTVDENASRNPLGPQKDLKPRVLSRSLLNLLQDYFRLKEVE